MRYTVVEHLAAMDIDGLQMYDYQDPLESMDVENLLIPARNFPWSDTRLPDAVKRRILKTVLCVESIEFYSWRNANDCNLSGNKFLNIRILATCQEIHSEGRQIFWQQNHMLFTGRYGEFLQTLEKDLGYKTFDSNRSPSVAYFSPTSHIYHVTFVKKPKLMVLGNPNQSESGDYRCKDCRPRPGFDVADLTGRFQVVSKLHLARFMDERNSDFTHLELTFAGLDLDIYPCSLLRQEASKKVGDTVKMIRTMMQRLSRVDGGLKAKRLILKDFPRGEVGHQIYESFQGALKYAQESSVTDIHGFDIVPNNGHMILGFVLPVVNVVHTHTHTIFFSSPSTTSAHSAARAAFQPASSANRSA